MPELLTDGLPDKTSRSRFDFSQWTDGQAWKFVKGDDYKSSTETFRANVKRWAKQHGYAVDLRPYPATDRDGHDIPLVKSDALALGVQFIHNGGHPEAGPHPRREDTAARSARAT
jgi:hypothetical protein